jgi:hypothetical protein
MVSQFMEKVSIYSNMFSQKMVLPAFFSLGGFTDEAIEFCKISNVATTDQLRFIL